MILSFVGYFFCFGKWRLAACSLMKDGEGEELFVQALASFWFACTCVFLSLEGLTGSFLALCNASPTRAFSIARPVAAMTFPTRCLVPLAFMCFSCVHLLPSLIRKYKTESCGVPFRAVLGVVEGGGKSWFEEIGKNKLGCC